MSDTRFIIQPGGSLAGRVRVPGDKSISHRAVMLAAIARGTSRIIDLADSQDCRATLDALAAMGLKHGQDKHGARLIQGLGLRGLRAPAAALDLGNSGTAMRLLSGLLAGQAFDTVLTGDSSLSQRPMKRVILPLTRMGAQIVGRAGDRAPLSITGGIKLVAIDYRPPVASAQIKSCVLLAGLYAHGRTRVHEPGVSRDHTERLLGAFGVELEHQANAIALTGGQTLEPAEIAIPADLSSAAFFLVAAAIAPGSDLIVENVGVNATRRGVIDILRSMGADITLDNERDQSGEPVADIRVRGSALRGIEIGAEQVALAIDECPALFIAAACADGVTRVTGAAELRVKECDRIAAMADGLRRLGVDCEETDDGLIISGRGSGDAFSGGAIASRRDHRIAMSFAVAALRAAGPITVDSASCVDTSFPGFIDCARRAGLRLEARAKA